MSVQRYTADGYGAQQGEMMPDPEGPWMLAADHARIVAERVAEVTDALIDARREALAELEQAHAAALAEEQQRGYAVAAALLRQERRDHAPRTLTADDPEPAVGSVVLFDGLPYIRQGNKWVAPRANIAYWYEFMRDERPTVLIHDGEATPQVKPCSTCGEPVAYLTARPGWAGGWLHHPARPLDGHPAAIDGEATT